MNKILDEMQHGLPVPITEERPWASFAACRDHDPFVFFPLATEEERDAIRICEGCPVSMDCLEFALKARISYGIWGGMTEKQRRSFRRMIA